MLFVKSDYENIWFTRLMLNASNFPKLKLSQSRPEAMPDHTLTHLEDSQLLLQVKIPSARLGPDSLELNSLYHSTSANDPAVIIPNLGIQILGKATQQLNMNDKGY